MSMIPLKLSAPEAPDDCPLRFERRRSPRRVITGRVTAVLHTGAHGEATHRICSLQLKDISDTGVGVVSQEPIVEGTRITVFFAPHGAEPGFDLRGTTVRCAARAWGYDVGMRIEQRLAA